MNNNVYVKSPLNYTGGKFRLLPQFARYFPENADVFVDLFCGGASVGLNVEAANVVLNDIDGNVIGILELFSRRSAEFITRAVEDVISRYGLSDSAANGYAFYGCNSSAGLAKFNRSKYIRLRNDFNALAARDDEYYIKLFSLIIFSFNNQIRFNSKGCFNLPAGKRDFNARAKKKVVRFADKLKEDNINLSNLDFRLFNLDNLTHRSFIYADPPYLLGCATYNERNAWNEKDERDLLLYLSEADRRGIRFALSNIISRDGQTNRPLAEWLERNPRFTPHRLDYNYSNANYHKKNRDKSPVEVLITNYV